MRLFSSVDDWWIPGVSTNTIWAARKVSTPCIAVRVVCGRGATMASLVPSSAFSSVDFPALGRPRIETNPARYFTASLSSGLGHAHFFDAQMVRGQHFNLNAVLFDFLAYRGHVPQPFRDQPADGSRFRPFRCAEFQEIT